MRCVVQRVSRARVVVEGEGVGSIDHGLLALVGAMRGDTQEDVAVVARKLATLRVFPDAAGRMSLSVKDVAGKILLVSQFTLCAELAKGARPSFTAALEPEAAALLLDAMAAALAREVTVERGRFGAHMQVELVNDGPVTLWIDSRT